MGGRENEGRDRMYDAQRLDARLRRVRSALLMEEPFFGNLVMQLDFVAAPCGTACTDMRRIEWDPDFVDSLSEADLLFTIKHEVLHCALRHPLRGRRFRPHILYNLAADIVVNSIILESMDKTDYTFQNRERPVPHRTPDGEEGRDYTAEQVFNMLCGKYSDRLEELEFLSQLLYGDFGEPLDAHDWEEIEDASHMESRWSNLLREIAGRYSSSSSMPPSLRQWIQDDARAQVDWRKVLQDFVELAIERMDYTFLPSDRRFSEMDFFLPAFHEVVGEQPGKLWFLVDTSGSITNACLGMIYAELTACMERFPGMRINISFFDMGVTDPVTVEDVEELRRLMPLGGGGTSFYSIFKYMEENLLEALPEAMVILSDGQAPYPPESCALEIPVLWILWNAEKDAPWGKTVHVTMK